MAVKIERVGLLLVLSQRDDSIPAGTPGGCHFTKSFYQVIIFSPSHFPFAKSFYQAILEIHNDRSDTSSLASGISTDTSTAKTPHNCLSTLFASFSSQIL